MIFEFQLKIIIDKFKGKNYNYKKGVYFYG